MLKLIALLGFAVIQARAENLYYGAQSVDQAINSFCYFHATVPVLAPVYNADGATKDAAKLMNQRWQNELDHMQGVFQLATRAKGACSNLDNAIKATLNFSVSTALDAPILSVVFQEYTYTGGAHGLRVTRAETLDADTGESFANLASFLKPSGLEKLKSTLEDQLTNIVPNFDPDAGWTQVKASWTSLAKIDNFYFTPDGVVIYFNVYQIAPYSVGVTNVLVEWDDLRVIGVLASGPAAKLKLAP